MDYERCKPKYSRPAGRGAFFDYGMTMANLYAPRIQSGGAGPKSKARPPAPQPEQAGEERWDGEGGNSPIPPARR